MKATYIEINKWDENVTGNGKWITESREIFKDPITDDGVKKSAKGLLAVELIEGEYKLFDQQDWLGESQGQLQTIFKDGKFYNTVTFAEIRERVKSLI